jgi:hypothetical protein
MIVTVSAGMSNASTQGIGQPLPAGLGGGGASSGASVQVRLGSQGPSKVDVRPQEQDGRRTGSEPPMFAYSHYLTSAGQRHVHRLGCKDGQRIRRHESLHDAVVVLAFGRPVREHGHFGASLFGHRFITTEGIIRAGQAYVRGFERCVGPSAAATLTLSLGTSNFGRQVSYAHGRAWAIMVNRTNDWLRDSGYRRVEVTAANDIELGWNTPRRTRQWVDGYGSVADWPYYNFGDAGACPPFGDCHGAWTQEDVWYVSWGARWAWPLPQIYTGNGIQAKQWYRLSLYSQQRHGQPMTILGAMSQRTACKESRDPCRGMNNSPKRAWRQLWSALNRDPRTAQRLRWATDMEWSNK